MHHTRTFAFATCLCLAGACKSSSSSEAPTKEVGGPPVVQNLGVVTGTSASEWVGYSLGPAGDINGDKIPDFFVTGLSASLGGRLGVILGPLAGSISIAQADIQITGERGFENVGESSVEAGGCDIDGDGFADIITGAPFADRKDIGTVSTSGDNAGRVYVIYGSKSPPGSVGAAQADEIFVGENPYDVAGKSVACLGDLDGDGKDDFAIGAPRAGKNREGAVYIFYGRSRGSYGAKPVGVEGADAIFRGSKDHELAGAFIARVGDLNGDGKQDIAIGAPNASEGGQYAGALYLLLGTGKRYAGAASLPAGPVVRGDVAGRRLGFTFARAGDFDGDGKDDLLVGTSTVLDATKSPGEAYVVRGRASFADTIRASEEIVLFGEKAGDLAGVSVAGLGDLDGDGRGDVAVGAVRGDGDEPNAGRAYFIRGRAVTAGTRLPLGSELVVARGKKADDHLGEVIRGADTDGDGLLDLLVAARGEAVGAQAGAGSIYIIAGKGLGGR